MTQPQPQPQPERKAIPEGAYVCNVQAWGSNPTYHQGEFIPPDCPYDVEAAAKQGKVLTTEQYQKAHPEWDPEAEKKAEAEAQVQAAVYPGYDAPTAADMPDPVATQQMYAEAEAEAEGAQPKREPGQEKPPEPVQVQQSSQRSGGSSSTSKT